MSIETNEGQHSALMDPKWISLFRERVLQCAVNQLVPAADRERLMVMSMIIVIAAHERLSTFGTSQQVREKLRLFSQELAANEDPGQADPPRLEEMTIVMDMAATAFSMIEHRRVQSAYPELDYPTEDLADALMMVVRQSCKAGGHRAAASVRPLLLGYSHACASSKSSQVA